MQREEVFSREEDKIKSSLLNAKEARPIALAVTENAPL
jgi:hypothetical protein